MPVLTIILLFGIILGPFSWKIIQKTQNSMLFPKSDFQKKKAPARMLVIVVRSGDAPKPPFPIKTDKKLENPENQHQINHRYSRLCICCIKRFLRNADFKQLYGYVVPVATGVTALDFKDRPWRLLSPNGDRIEMLQASYFTPHHQI